MVCIALPMDPSRIVQLDPTWRFTTSCTPKLHWQLAVIWRGSQSQNNFLKKFLSKSSKQLVGLDLWNIRYDDNALTH